MKEQGNSEFMICEETLHVMEHIAEGIPGGFFIYHADGDEELIYINKAMLRIFGCDTEEELREHTRNSFKGIVHPDDLEEVERSIEKQIATNSTRLDYVEYRIIRKDGTVRWVEDYGHFMQTKAYGDIFYVFIEDATERLAKRLSNLEEINRELTRAYTQEEQYKRAILHDALMFFEIDITKDEFISSGAQLIEKRIAGAFDTKAVPHFKTYTEYVSYWESYIREDDKEQFREFFALDRLASVYVSEPEQIFDAWITDAFGADRLLRYMFLLGKSELNGDVIALSVIKDITDTAEHRRVLEAAWKQAEIANIARKTFINNLSHDIKTPMNGIVGYADLMRRHMDDKEKLTEYIDRIQDFSRQLSTIWNKSIELTHMESGKVIVKEEKCDLGDVLKEVSQRCRLKAEAKNIKFCSDFSKAKRRYIMADKEHLREILWQLLDNAIKFTYDNGSVWFTASELSDSPEGSVRYKFSVKDTGKGMHKEFLDRLFEPFERENTSTQSGVFGVGLGLTITKNLVDLMEGSIKIESEPGKGSEFTVMLMFPLQYTEKPKNEEEEKQVLLEGKNLLVVEDNEINREITEEFLTDLGFKVDTATDGADAVKKVQSSDPYDIILMDIQMPVMDGYEAAKAIRGLSDEVRSKVPIIAVTADTYSASQEKSLEAGMNAHCPKPVNFTSLCDMISTLLSSRELQI